MRPYKVFFAASLTQDHLAVGPFLYADVKTAVTLTFILPHKKERKPALITLITSNQPLAPRNSLLNTF